jgi:Domain of unknown function (DUF4382)
MKSKAFTLLLLSGVLFTLTSCSGVKNACTSCTPTGNATLNLTLSDTPPTGVNIISFTMPIVGISLTPSTGSPVSVFSSGTFELTHLQSDSDPIAVGVSVPAGSYTSVNVTLGTSTGIFVNASGATIGTCVVNALCTLPNGAATTISIPVTLTLTANQVSWIGLDVNLNNVITTSNGISIDFTQTGVMTALTTPRTNIPSGDVDSIDDWTGLVTAYTSGSSITVKSGTRGTMVATITSATTYDDPQNLCTGFTNIATCISTANPTVVSVQAYLTNTGAINVSEIDVIGTSSSDSVEGFIYPSSCNGAGSFGLILFDSTVISGNTTLTSLPYGSGFCLTMNPTAVFLVDTGLLTTAIPSGASQSGFLSPSDMAIGQVVRVQVSNVTAGTLVGATANSVLLRYSRISGTVNTVSASNFSINGAPAYLGFTLPPVAATFINNTIFEGVTGASGLASPRPVAIRALFFKNSGTSPVSTASFIAAKVRAN